MRVAYDDLALRARRKRQVHHRATRSQHIDRCEQDAHAESLGDGRRRAARFEEQVKELGGE